MAGGANPQMTANPFAQASGAQQAALAGTGAGMNYMPSQVQAVNPATQIGQFQNPYESQVVQQSLADLGQAQEVALNNLAHKHKLQTHLAVVGKVWQKRKPG